MKRTLYRMGLALLAAASLISCDPGPQGLFAGLEREEPLDNGTEAFNSNTPAFVVRVGSDYYAGVGAALLRRPVAGDAWETVTDAGAPAGSVITAGVFDGTALFVSYSPSSTDVLEAQKRIRRSTDGTTWSDWALNGLPTLDGLDVDKPVQVQNLLYAGGQLFAVTQYSTGASSSDYKTFYSIYSDDGFGNFSATPVADMECGLPSSVAFDGTNYWIAAGDTMFTGTTPGGLAEDDTNATAAGFSSTNPVLDVYYDSVNSVALAAATGKVWLLSTGGYTASGTFGSSSRRLSSLIVVPANAGTTVAGSAVLVGVKSWASDSYTGYYEYDANYNSSFSSSIVPNSTWTMVSDDSNYVTTLDDLSIEGFYYDGNASAGVLFARTVKGGLWSNTWDGTAWSGWNRE